jgi:hypothetical protein
VNGRHLWLPILIGPLAWVAYLQTVSALVPWACRRPTGGMIALLAAGVLALALSTAGLVTAWQAWQAVGPGSPAGTVTGRTRLIALTGIGATALLILTVVAGMLPLLLLAPCN